MVSSLSNQLAPTAGRPVSSRRVRSNANSFSTQFSAPVKKLPDTAGAGLTDRLATASRAGRASSPKAAIAKTPPVSRQNSVATTGKLAEAGPVNSGGFTDTQSAVAVLSQALKAAGIDPGSLGLNGHDDPVSFPGTNGWVNHEITLQAGSRTENFSADLVAKNPEVAVIEIQRLLAMG